MMAWLTLLLWYMVAHFLIHLIFRYREGFFPPSWKFLVGWVWRLSRKKQMAAVWQMPTPVTITVHPVPVTVPPPATITVVPVAAPQAAAPVAVSTPAAAPPAAAPPAAAPAVASPPLGKVHQIPPAPLPTTAEERIELLEKELKLHRVKSEGSARYHEGVVLNLTRQLAAVQFASDERAIVLRRHMQTLLTGTNEECRAVMTVLQAEIEVLEKDIVIPLPAPP